MQIDDFHSFKDKVQGTRIAHLLGHARNYMTAEVATRALGFISIPVFTRLFTTEDFGVVAVFNSYFAIFSVLIALNAHASVGRYYYENTDDFPDFVGTTLVLVVLILVVVGPFFYFFYDDIMGLLDLPGSLLTFLLIACICEVLYRVYTQVLVPQKRSKEAAFITVIRGYVTFGAAVLFVSLLHTQRYRGQIWATVLTGLFFFAYFVLRMRGSLKLGFNLKHFKYIARFSFPLIPYALSGVLLAQFDRIMINAAQDSSATGLYSLGHNIGKLIFLVNHAVQMAFTPYYFEMMDKGEHRYLDKTTGRVISLITLAALVLIFFAREIGEVLADEAFHEGLVVIPPVAIGYVFFSVYFVYGRFIGYEKKTYYSSLLVITAGVANILLNAKFIPEYGYIAAAYTTLVSYLLLAVLTWLAAKFLVKPRSTPLWVVGRPLVSMFVCLGIYHLVAAAALPFWLVEIVKVVLILVFSAVVFFKDLIEMRKSFSKTTLQ